MSDYAIGDIQGCYDSLMRLLEHLQFNDRQDRLWFVGDLVNRGPDSLKVLRFIKQLPLTPFITLGNHDLHLLNVLFCAPYQPNAKDTFLDVLKAYDGEELGHWLRCQSILIYDSNLNMVMSHAGIPPFWSLEEALVRAKSLENKLRSPDFVIFLKQMYGNKPSYWSDDLAEIDQLRLTVNAFTRMRFCDATGSLKLDYKGTIQQAPPGYIPWFKVENRKAIPVDMVFGHWAALQNKHPAPGLYAIDSGCVWGGPLTALRLLDRQYLSV